jgi:hypothetical protein
VAIAFATNLELWTEGRHELARQLAALLAGPGQPSRLSPTPPPPSTSTP